MMTSTRICNCCGGVAVPVKVVEKKCSFSLEARTVKATFKCTGCGRVFQGNIGRLEQWHSNLNDKIAFYMRRKEWAREKLKANELFEPGEEISGLFEGEEYKIKIGPRRGVKISLVNPL